MFHVIQTQHKAFNAKFHTGKLVYEGKEYNWVYDCGSKPLAHEYLKTVDKIDLIFISHFDSDHISGIPTLLADKKTLMARIIVPYLSSEDILILISEGYDLLFESVEEEESFSRFINRLIRETELNSDSDEIDLSEELYEWKIQTVQTKRDFTLTIQAQERKIWLFKTHVFEEEGLKQELQSLLQGTSLRRQLKNNFKQFVADFREKYKKEIRQIKSKLGGSESRNVMTMSMISMPCRQEIPYRGYEHQTAWLHTGDAYLSDNGIFNQFLNFCIPFVPEINYCVLPHHASIKSANVKLYRVLNGTCHYIITPRSHVSFPCIPVRNLFCVAKSDFQTIYIKNLDKYSFPYKRSTILEGTRTTKCCKYALKCSQCTG